MEAWPVLHEVPAPGKQAPCSHGVVAEATDDAGEMDRNGEIPQPLAVE
jgi:hypothetical protein